MKSHSPLSLIVKAKNRAGITLLEVLVSIGVLSVGLLGVLALMPAASQQTKSGTQKDAAASMARRAFREMNVRWYGVDDALTDPPNNAQYTVVDPVGFKLSLAAGNGANPLLHGGVSSAHRVLPKFQQNATARPPLSHDGAIDEVFRSPDDLDFGLRASYEAVENEAPNPPQQKALKNSSDQPVKRNTFGKLSWFATIVPRNTGFNTVSVAIVRERASEFNLEVSEANISGGVGEVTIPFAAVGTPVVEAFTELKAGQWIMLASADADAPTVGTAEWYRVTSASKIDSDNDGTDDQFVASVVGADWLQLVDHGGNANDPKTYAILVPETVAVYQRTLPATQ